MPLRATLDPLISKAIDDGLQLLSDGSLVWPDCTGVKIYKPDKNGYVRVYLYRRSVNLARIICWMTHGPPPSNIHQIDHINGQKADNRPENLRWVTQKENRNAGNFYMPPEGRGLWKREPWMNLGPKKRPSLLTGSS